MLVLEECSFRLEGRARRPQRGIDDDACGCVVLVLTSKVKGPGTAFWRLAAACYMHATNACIPRDVYASCYFVFCARRAHDHNNPI